jgi:phenylacetate-CoA ligase
MKKYWNEEMETIKPDALRRLEGDLLNKQVKSVYRESRFYNDKFNAAGIKPEVIDRIRDIADLAQLPFTEKVEFSDGQKDGSLIGPYQRAPMDKIVRVQGTGGSSGRPLRSAWTRNDNIAHDEMECRSMWSMGCRPGDIVINCFNYCLYSGGINTHMGFDALGAATVSYGVGNSRGLLDFIASLRPGNPICLSSTPSYAVRLADLAVEMGLDPKKLGLKRGFFSGEAAMQIPGYRERIESLWNMPARDDYGATEIFGQSADCDHLTGLHYFGAGITAVELIDPETENVKPVTQDATGELVFTTLTREACPALRFRSHDYVQTFTEPCPCGRTGFRFKVLGRTDDMIAVKGSKIIPNSIQEILFTLQPRLPGQFRIVLNDPPPFDYEPILEVEVSRDLPESKHEELRAELKQLLRMRSGIHFQILLVPQGQIASEHKTRRLHRAYLNMARDKFKH